MSVESVKETRSVLAVRVLLGLVGVGCIAFGAVRIVQNPSDTKPVSLAKWLIGSLLVHDVIIAPIVIGIGWLIARFVPARASAYVQGGLVSAGLVSAIGVVMIRRQHKYGAKSLALLQQDYKVNLLILLAIVLVVTVACYLGAVWRSNRTNSRSPADQ